MEEIIASKTGRIQFAWEGVLKWFAFSIMCLQLSRGILMYLIPASLDDLLFVIEKCIVLVLIIAAFGYVLYTKIKTSNLMFRINHFIKGMFRPEFADAFFIFCLEHYLFYSK